ncbi:DUF4214 domain-containing protein [Halomonas sp. H10-9-1]|uniref:DUF4214 domain-containing protein n=1 Tax=Halomonas sp. H10-9-1 TaxID=2950871 RepID=UPI0032DF48F5
MNYNRFSAAFFMPGAIFGLAQVTTSQEADEAAPQELVGQLVTSASDAYADAIQTLYIAYYGRPGDPDGMAFWTAQALANDGDLESLVAAFGSSEEYTEGLAQLEPEAQVEALYLQIFGRDADEEGLDFYSQALADGDLSLAEIALTIVNGAAEDDREVLDARLDVAKAVTAALDSPEELAELSSEEGLQAMRDLLGGVTSREQADAVLEDVDKAVGDALDTPLPEPTVTLAAALENTPESAYRLDTEAQLQAGTLSVSAAQDLFADAQSLVNGAENAAAVDLDNLLAWQIQDSAQALIDAADEAVVQEADAVGVTDEQVTLAQATALEALANFDGDLPTVSYILQEALDAGENRYSDYAIQVGSAVDAGTLSVDEASQALSDLEALIGGAQNAGELEAGELLNWSIEDGVAAILSASDDLAISGAETVSVTSDQVTLAQAEELQALENFDGELPTVLYTLEQALDAEELPGDYALLDLPYAAEELSVDEAEAMRSEAQSILSGAANADDLELADLLSWTLLDSGQSLLAAVESEAFQQADSFAFDSGNQVYVDNDGEVSGYQTLQKAIAAADDGATLLAAPGEYAEDVDYTGAVSVNVTGMTLNGANAGVAGTDQGRVTESIINGKLDVAASDITIDGFTIDHDDGYALSMSAGTNLVFQNNIVTGAEGTQLDYHGGPNDTLTFHLNP